MNKSSTKRDDYRGVTILFVAVFACCLAIAPREVNGDGIGYLKAARDGVLYPGHLAYLPLLRAVWWTARAFGLSGSALADGIWPGRVLSALGAALASVLCAGIGRRNVWAGAGLGASAAVLGSGCDLESYAPALAALLAVVWLLERDRVVLAALTLSLATLLHVENALFGLAALALTTRRLQLVLVSAGATVAAYGIAGLSLASLPHASHGFTYPLHLYTPLVAVWGALRTLVFVPYPYEASLLRVALGTVVAAVLAIAIAWRLHVPLPRRVVVAWLAPYALVGVVFFPSDPERWIFVLPLLWLAARPRPALVATLLVVNLVMWLPRALASRAVDTARTAAAHLQRGDLVVMPGHGWDESIALYAVGVQPFPLVYHAAARGGAAGLGAALDEALQAGGRVVSVRLDDAPDPSGTLGYKELARFGLDRTALRALLEAHGLSPDRALGDGVTSWVRRR